MNTLIVIKAKCLIVAAFLKWLVRETLGGKVHRMPFGCWWYTGSTDGKGYGLVVRSGKKARAHRIVYETLHGPIPPGYVVRHRCDCPSCVNPLHLALGSNADNVADRVARNRSARGSGNGRSKLTEGQVYRILRRIRAGQSDQEIASTFGVSRRTIRQIRQGETWRHLGIP